MFKIRAFEPTDAEYEGVALVEKTVFPENADSVDDFRYADKVRNRDYLFQRLVVTIDDQIVGFAQYKQLPVDGRYRFDIIVHPEYERRGIGTAVYTHTLQAIQPLTPSATVLGTYAYQHKHQSMRFLEKRGFCSVMRWISSTLDVASFKSTDFDALAAKIAAQGIRIMPLPQIKLLHPNWQRELYDLDWKLLQDEPQPYPPKRLPFDRYIKLEVENPNTLHDAWFVAVDKNQFVGMTQLYKSDNPEMFKTGFTGVVRSHRRRGLATLLKAYAIRYAQQANVKIVRTGNEENNPMVQLNLNLGFKDITVQHAFEKKMKE